MKLLLDMNITPKLTAFLKMYGIESVHWYNIGFPSAKDSEIIKYAYDHDYIVTTCDLDFSTILSITREIKPSVVQLRFQGLDLMKTASLIALALKQNKNNLEKGAIMTIDPYRARTRLLPLL